MLSRECRLCVSELSQLHQLSKGLLKTINKHLPDRVGGAMGWNFEKAHSILHKFREIVMWVVQKTRHARGQSMLISI